MSHTIEQLDAEASVLLAKYSSNGLKNKDRLAIPVQEMPSQAPEIRVNTTEEAALGYTEPQV
ncbi:MAG: dihydropyrimidine dehydrogenase, partial [Sphaerochaetaceae bacterium]|nr:dihydropyrimidine dehydrogenase [Sphaerochaetaceae bacterium]